MKVKRLTSGLCHKVQFKSAKDAYAARDKATSQGFQYDGVHAYRCPYCKTFHLGHPPKK